MEEPAPASFSMTTSWPLRTSSCTPAGVMATRYSWFLTSRGMPTFTAVARPSAPERREAPLPRGSRPGRTGHGESSRRDGFGSGRHPELREPSSETYLRGQMRTRGCCMLRIPYPSLPSARSAAVRWLLHDPRMRPYARTPWRAVRQVVADLLAVGLVLAAVRLARVLHDLILRLAEPGRQLARTGEDLAANLHQAAERVGGLPLVGDDVRGPLDRAGQAAGTLVRAGQEQQAVVGQLAMLVAVLVVAFPVLVLLVTWLPLRLRFARRAN